MVSKDKRDKKKTIEDLLKSKIVVVQSISGVMYIGTFGGIHSMGPGLGNAQIVLTDAKIIGKKHEVKTPLVVISMKHVAHYHIIPEEVVEKQTT